MSLLRDLGLWTGNRKGPLTYMTRPRDYLVPLVDKPHLSIAFLTQHLRSPVLLLFICLVISALVVLTLLLLHMGKIVYFLCWPLEILDVSSSIRWNDYHVTSPHGTDAFESWFSSANQERRHSLHVCIPLRGLCCSPGLSLLFECFLRFALFVR